MQPAAPQRSAPRPLQTLATALFGAIVIMGLRVQRCAGQDAADAVPLVAAGARWTYWDSATAVGDTWALATYPDSTWKTGAAPIGFGNGDEATKTSVNKVVQYFRLKFAVRGGRREGC
jgi:hypothetical protein